MFEYFYHLNYLFELYSESFFSSFSCGHTQECYPLDCVRGVVGEDNDYKFFVATNDTRFSQENLLIPIVSGDKGKFGIKNLSKEKRRHARQLDSVCEVNTFIFFTTFYDPHKTRLFYTSSIFKTRRN